jgi:hypothetical protein
MPTRAEMDEAIKSVVVPHLGTLGFKGTRPNFYRKRDGDFDLLSFQFSQWGGRFVVELARIPGDGLEFYGELLKPPKAKPSYLHPFKRHRLGAQFTPKARDFWFEFEGHDPHTVADEVLAELAKPGLWEYVAGLSV